MVDMLAALDEEPGIDKPEAFRRQIAHLKQGESAARVTRLALGSTEVCNLSETTRRLRLSIDAEVSKQRKTSGRDLVVEQGTIITSSGHMLIVIAVTRQ